MTPIPCDTQYEYLQKPYVYVCDKDTVESFYHKQDTYETKEGETIFIIARHGENESNVAGTYDGRTLNMPLTEKGLAQGISIGQRLSEKVAHIDHVITTPMIRTHQTAMKIMEAFADDQPVFIEDARFLERFVGKYEGRPLKEYETINKTERKISSSTDRSFEEKMKYVVEEGIESFAAVWARVYASLQQNSTELKNKVVLIVTHSGTMRSIYWHLTQELGFFVPYDNFKPDNGAYMIVSAKNGQYTLLDSDDIQIIPQ